MSKIYERSLLFGGDFCEQCHIYKEFLCVVGIERAPRPPETRASFGVPGAISPLPLSSLAVTAKSLLRKSGLSDQHWSKHNGEVAAAAEAQGGGAVVCDFAQGSDGFNTFNRTQKPAPPLLHREREEPDACKTTVRWYSQPVTPWELAVSRANGDQCARSWICFPPKLLITEVTLMWRGHFSQVTLIHLLAPCFVSFWLKPLTISLFARRWRDLINLVL